MSTCESSSNDECGDIVPHGIREAAKNIFLNLLPDKSKRLILPDKSERVVILFAKMFFSLTLLRLRKNMYDQVCGLHIHECV